MGRIPTALDAARTRIMKTALDGIEEAVSKAESELDLLFKRQQKQQESFNRRMRNHYIFLALAVLCLFGSLGSDIMFSALRQRSMRNQLQRMQQELQRKAIELDLLRQSQTNAIPQLERQ